MAFGVALRMAFKGRLRRIGIGDKGNVDERLFSA